MRGLGGKGWVRWFTLCIVYWYLVQFFNTLFTTVFVYILWGNKMNNVAHTFLPRFYGFLHYFSHWSVWEISALLPITSQHQIPTRRTTAHARESQHFAASLPDVASTVSWATDDGLKETAYPTGNGKTPLWYYTAYVYIEPAVTLRWRSQRCFDCARGRGRGAHRELTAVLARLANTAQLERESSFRCPNNDAVTRRRLWRPSPPILWSANPLNSPHCFKGFQAEAKQWSKRTIWLVPDSAQTAAAAEVRLSLTWRNSCVWWMDCAEDTHKAPRMA